MFGPLGLSFAPQVRASRTLTKWLKPIATWYANFAGYRRMGLRYDDLLVEENEQVERALKRLTKREAYDRAYRFRVASQASVLHKDLPQNQWVKPENDVRYLKPLVEDVEREVQERQMWDTVEVARK